MKVTLPRSELKAALDIAARAIAGQTSLPVLKNVLVEATGTGEVRLAATDLSLHLEVTRAAQVTRPGTVCVPGKRLQEIVSALPEGDIALEGGVDGENHLLFTCRKSTYRLLGLPPEDLPVLPEDPESAARFVLPAKVMRGLCQSVACACSQDDTKPVLTACLFRLYEDRLELAATDTHRLAHAQEPVAETTGVPKGKAVDALVPGAVLGELQRVFGDGDDPVTVALGTHGAVFRGAGVLLHTRLVEGVFPRFERVIPTSWERRVQVQREDLMACLRRCRLLARDGAAKDRVTLQVEPLLSRLVLEAEGESGKAHEEVDAGIEGSELTLALNATYLLELLETLPTDECLLLLGEELSPMLVQPTEGRFRAVLMPMNVK